ncbi:MAG: restriction endonuclease subunit S [Candidatus Bathyarchaeota archaeon]|nr:MAG: restriction endonuclease subunit S [Candidatus Bathyarchaeota archaeon]
MTNLKQEPIVEFHKEWTVHKVKDVFSLEYGKGLPTRQRVFGKYPVVGSNGIIDQHNEALVIGPGIVVGRKGTIGAISWMDSDFWPIDTTYYVKVKRDDVFIRWLFYKLSHLNLERFNMSDVVPGLKRDLVYSINFAIPPFPEQKKIAGVLSTVDDAIRLVDVAIARTERLKKRLIQKLFTVGIGNTEFKETKIGKIPETWKVIKLEKLLKVQGGFAFKSADYVKDGVPLLRIANVSFGEITQDNLVRLPPNYIRDYSEFALKENDLLIVLTRPIIEGGFKAGKITSYDLPALLNQRIGRLRLKKSDQINSDFMFYLMFSSSFINQMQKGLAVMNQPNISTRKIERFNIPLPPIQEQKKIAEVLTTIDLSLCLHKKRKQKVQRIKQGLMNELLSGRKRVRVGVSVA